MTVDANGLRLRCPAPHSDMRRIPSCGQWYAVPYDDAAGRYASFWRWDDERVHPVTHCSSCAAPYRWHPDTENPWVGRERAARAPLPPAVLLNPATPAPGPESPSQAASGPQAPPQRPRRPPRRPAPTRRRSTP